MADETTLPVEMPPGDYAIIELFGHSTLVGRGASRRKPRMIADLDPRAVERLSTPIIETVGGYLLRGEPSPAKLQTALQALALAAAGVIAGAGTDADQARAWFAEAVAREVDALQQGAARKRP